MLYWVRFIRVIAGGVTGILTALVAQRQFVDSLPDKIKLPLIVIVTALASAAAKKQRDRNYVKGMTNGFFSSLF